MKSKIICLFLSLTLAAVILFSCSGNRKEPETAGTAATADTPETQTRPDTETAPLEPIGTEPDTEDTEAPAPEVVIPVGIYDCIYEGYDGERYGRVGTLYDDMSRGIDLCVVGIFLSDEEVVSGSKFQDIWRDCISKIGTDVSAYRTGFVIDYTTAAGHTVSMTIMKPEDILVDGNWEYVEMYTYDDIANEYAGWYYHLLPETFDGSSLITSFKVTAGNRISEVPEIHLTVFLYLPEEMDKIYEDNGYIERLNRHSVTIIPSNYR